MMKEIVLFKCKERKYLQSVTSVLHQPADRLAHNQVILRRDVEELALDTLNNVILELKVEEEDKKRTIR